MATVKEVTKKKSVGPAPRFDAWEVLGFGGFGGQFDPLVSPHDTNVVLMRCDMTGAYISHDAGAVVAQLQLALLGAVLCV